MTKKDEAMKMLDQMENALGKWEKKPDFMPTNRALLIVARAVYWLMERYIREH